MNKMKMAVTIKSILDGQHRVGMMQVLLSSQQQQGNITSASTTTTRNYKNDSLTTATPSKLIYLPGVVTNKKERTTSTDAVLNLEQSYNSNTMTIHNNQPNM
jgi:hypothetical protein